MNVTNFNEIIASINARRKDLMSTYVSYIRPYIELKSVIIGVEDGKRFTEFMEALGYKVTSLYGLLRRYLKNESPMEVYSALIAPQRVERRVTAGVSVDVKNPVVAVEGSKGDIVKKEVTITKEHAINKLVEILVDKVKKDTVIVTGSELDADVVAQLVTSVPTRVHVYVPLKYATVVFKYASHASSLLTPFTEYRVSTRVLKSALIDTFKSSKDGTVRAITELVETVMYNNGIDIYSEAMKNLGPHPVYLFDYTVLTIATIGAMLTGKPKNELDMVRQNPSYAKKMAKRLEVAANYALSVMIEKIPLYSEWAQFLRSVPDADKVIRAVMTGSASDERVLAVSRALVPFDRKVFADFGKTMATIGARFIKRTRQGTRTSEKQDSTSSSGRSKSSTLQRVLQDQLQASN